MSGPHRVKSLQDVVDWRLCIGCGACAFASPPGKIELVNLPTVGIRPRIQDPDYTGSECLSFCPGAGVSAPSDPAGSQRASEKEFGAAIEIWVGYAADPEIRFQASSGGILTALALFCIERGGMGSVLHTGKDEEQPWLNRTVQSRSRQQLLDRAGSRYAPSSPCDGLAMVENSAAPCVFIGKPCDVAAVASLRKTRPALDRNLGLVLTFFCAGTPSTQGTLDLAAGPSPSGRIVDLRYRGEGWPGEFKARWDDGTEKRLPYEQSWSRLTSYRPLRCNLCPDGLGALADISCGDAWDEYDPKRPNPGVSIVLVRTPRGQQILRQAIEAGYVTLQPAGPERVLAAQRNLLSRRHELFGRFLALRLLGIPIPRYVGFSLFSAWMRLPLGRKLRTIAGTLRRALVRRWWKRTSAPIGEPTGRVRDQAETRS
jgi:coenzyme F420 hydrogenase subunit beta